MATSIDGNEADGNSGKPLDKISTCQCTSTAAPRPKDYSPSENRITQNHHFFYANYDRVYNGLVGSQILVMGISQIYHGAFESAFLNLRDLN